MKPNMTSTAAYDRPSKPGREKARKRQQQQLSLDALRAIARDAGIANANNMSERMLRITLGY